MFGVIPVHLAPAKSETADLALLGAGQGLQLLGHIARQFNELEMDAGVAFRDDPARQIADPFDVDADRASFFRRIVGSGGCEPRMAMW